MTEEQQWPVVTEQEKMGSNKVEVDENDSNKHNLAQEGGPIKNRGCTDVICFLLFFAFLGGWGVVGYYGFKNGDPTRLIYPSDSSGAICGSSDKLANRPNLLFFDLTKCLKPGAVALGCLTKQVCVESCPDDTRSFWMEAKAFEEIGGIGEDHLRKDMEPYCDPENFSNDMKPIELMQEQICPYWILPSNPFVGRCIPFWTDENGKNITTDTDGFVFNSTAMGDNAPEGGLNFDTLLKKVEVLLEVLNLKSFGEKIFQDLKSSWWQILLAICLGGFVSFMWVIMMRFIAAVMVWSSILLSIGLLGLSCVYCGFKFTELGSNSNFDMGGFELTTDFGSYLELSQTWMVFLIISGITLLIILLLLCFMFTRIKIAIELIEEGSIAVGHMMSTLFFPFIPFVMEVIFVAWFFTVAAFLSSWNEEEFQININTLKKTRSIDPNCTLSNGTQLHDGDTCYNQSEVITCTNTDIQVTASCQFYRYGQTTEGLYMQIYNLFGFFWGLFFIEALDQMVLAGAFASWYWVLNKKDVPKMPLMSSFYRTFRYHIGTLAFGSLIIAIIRMIRVLIEYIEEKLKEYQQDNPLVKCMLCFCKCCFYCLEKFMKFLNRNAYIMTAVYGKNFCWSAKEAFKLLFRNLARVVVLDKVTDFLLLLGKLVIVGGVGVASFYVFSGRLQVTSSEIPQLNYYFVPIIIITLATYFIADIFFGVYEMAVDTLFLCFLEDIERNDGSDEKPYFMSKDLRKILGYMEPKSTPTSPK